MKKLFLAMTVSALCLLSSCGKEVTIEESVENVESVPKPQVHTASPVAEAFKAVLLNEETFSCTDGIPYENMDIMQQYDGYLSEILIDGNPMVTPQFAIVDLDGDTVPEVVLEIEDYYGFVVLRYREGEVTGNIVGYRTMYNLKEDGTFDSASSSSDDFMGKMIFIGDTFITSDKMHYFYSSLYIHDVLVTQETWDEYKASYDATPSVAWHEFSEDSIEQWLGDESFFTEIPEATMELVNERQNCLDSLSYLIDLNYNYTKKSQEEFNTDAKSYYDGCNEELTRIYELCEERLSEDEFEALNTDQQRWQESVDQRLVEDLSSYQVNSIEELENKTLYFTYGDIVLRRTVRLMNLYYDNHFYE